MIYREMGNNLCDLDTNVKVKGKKNGVPSTASLVLSFYLLIKTWFSERCTNIKVYDYVAKALKSLEIL